MPDTTPDTIVITCSRPAQNQTETVTLPPDLVAVLQYLSENVTVNDPVSGQPVRKYQYAANVIWTDVLTILLPIWTALYANTVNAPLQTQIASQEASIRSQIQQAVAAITVVGP
jgi:hypothetical protein